MNILYYVFVFIAGMGFAAQAAINGRLGLNLAHQPLLAALVSFAVGTLCLLLVAGFSADWHGASTALAQSQRVWWQWLGGCIGAAVVFSSIFLAPKIGITNTMFLFIIGQLMMGMLIDGFGWLGMPVRPIYWWKYFGLLLMLIGLVVFVFGERWLKK